MREIDQFAEHMQPKTCFVVREAWDTGCTDTPVGDNIVEARMQREAVIRKVAKTSGIRLRDAAKFVSLYIMARIE